MKSLIYWACLAPMITQPAIAEEPAALMPDMLETIVGDDWTGSLTYMNYQAPFEDVTIRANAEISTIDQGIQIDYKYPDEPHANSTVRARLSKDGQKFLGAPITDNQVLDNEARRIKTQFSCEDMGRPATCEMIYILSEAQLEITKMVTYDGEVEAFRRNTYAFSR